MASRFSGSGGGRGVQLRPRRRREGLGRDLLLVAGAVAGVAVVVALLVWLVVPAQLRAGFPGSAGAAGGGPLDVPIDRVISRQADGRTALASFTLRMRPEAAPAQLRAVAARNPGSGGAGAPTPTARQGSAEALLRDRIGAAVGGLRYEQTAGEAGKELLRQTVRDAVNGALPGQPVQAVFIREYVVQ